MSGIRPQNNTQCHENYVLQWGLYEKKAIRKEQATLQC